MKAKCLFSITALGFALALPCMAQPGVTVTAPSVVIGPPPTVVITPATAPTSYVWDGSEYVGAVGGQYYYLAPSHVWMPLDTGRSHRFEAWETNHPNWRDHATRNLRYRNMGNANRPQPMNHTVPVPPNSDVINHPPVTPVTPGSYGPPH